MTDTSPKDLPMYAVETQFPMTQPADHLNVTPSELGLDSRPLERGDFVRVAARYLNIARRQASCPAVMLVTLQAPEGESLTQAMAHQQLWMSTLRERLRQQLRRSDVLLPLEGGCMGIVLMDTLASAVPMIEQRLLRALDWPMEGSDSPQRPQLRVGSAVDMLVNGHEPSAEALVWAAEQDLHPADASSHRLN